MARGKGKGRRGVRRGPVDVRSSGESGSGGPMAPEGGSPGSTEPAVALWSKTRSGATAGRGFHYQDVVGAWLCGRVLAGELVVGRVVPEGFEDLACEGEQPVHVQVKSRQERVGDFSSSEVAALVLELAGRQPALRAAGQGGRIVLVLERSVDGERLAEWERPVGDLPDGHTLRTAVARVAARRGLSEEETAAAMRSVSVFVLPWRAAAEQVCAVVEQRYGLPRAAAEPVVLALRDAVADCVDVNAEADRWESRAGLDRTRIELLAGETAAVIDRDSLQEALAAGLCEPVDFDTPSPTVGYYEGVPAQPGDIAAGLPAPRPILTGQVVAAIDRGGTVLVTGPSGVGKSTVMWAAAYATRHVLWYRVRRLRDSDVEPLVRLARASRPSPRSPVGFVVDGVGIGASREWDMLHREVAAIPGMVLLGSARTEDLLPLETLPDCATVPVGLDEVVASQIHEGLLLSGATTTPHWRAAYDASGGLTLEFTYLLTRGQRLAEVITEQVRRRVRDGRDTELTIISQVSVAHRCGADLPLRDVRAQTGADDATFRRALARLDEEHLVRVEGSRLTGLHLLRSRALAEAVDRHPPPDLVETVDAVVPLLADDQLLPFVANALTTWPAVEVPLMDLLTDELSRRSSVAAWVGVLQGLRIVDFKRQADQWVTVLDRHNVEPAFRQVTLSLALARTDPMPGIRPEVTAAAAEIASTVDDQLPLRDSLLARAGSAQVIQMLLFCADSATALQLFAVLSGTRHDLTGHMTDVGRAPLVEVLRDANAEMFGHMIAAAQMVSDQFAACLFDAAGGQEAAFEKLRTHSPWLMEVGITDSDGSPVAYARLLHISALQSDVDHDTREFARVLLRCLPMCGSVDVQALLPGDLPIQIGRYTFGESRLRRRYDPPSTQVAWNRLRTRIAFEAAGAVDPTTRAHTARVIVKDLARYVQRLTRAWCISSNRRAELDELQRQSESLQERAARLSLPIGRGDADQPMLANTLEPLLDSQQDHMVTNDHLHTLVSGVADNLTSRLFANDPNWRTLAVYTGDTLRVSVQRVRAEERWELTDQEPPAEFDTIDGVLADLYAVLSELAWGNLGRPMITAAARSGNYDMALTRIAGLARTTADQRALQVRDLILAEGRQAGLRLEIHTRTLADAKPTDWPPTQYAVTVEIDRVTDWPPALQTLTGILAHDPTVVGPHTSLLVVPVMHGRSVALYARRVQQSIWPDEDLFRSWSDQLPPAHQTPLTDAVNEAYAALSALSGLALLATRRTVIPLHQDLADAQTDRFRRAVESVSSTTHDPVIDAILETLDAIAGRVEAEATETSDPGTEQPFAITIARGAVGEASDDFLMCEGVIMTCLQWDIDPEQAQRMIDQPAQPTSN